MKFGYFSDVEHAQHLALSKAHMSNSDAPTSLPKSMEAPMMSDHPDPHARALFNKMYEVRATLAAERPAVDANGKEALGRLFKIAQSDTGQARRVAVFLLGCYNGTRFPFDLTDFRTLDYELFQDCMAVLRMDYQPQQEVHMYFSQGGQRFEKLATDWGVTDVNQMRLELDELKARLGG